MRTKFFDTAAETLYRTGDLLGLTQRCQRLVDERRCGGGKQLAIALTDLAGAHCETGRFDDARQVLEEAMRLDCDNCVDGDNTEACVIDMSNLGRVNVYLGRLDDAEHLFHRAEALVITLPEHNLHYSTVLLNLGLLSMKRGEFKNAEKFYLRALRQRMIVYSVDHPRCTWVLFYLAMAYQKTGRTEAAIRILSKAVANFRKASDTENRDYAVMVGLLGSLQAKAGRRNDAQQLFDEAISILQRVRPPTDAALTDALAARAKLL